MLTFDNKCDDNVEYSEYSNELLSSVLENHTKSIMKIIKKENKVFNLNKILSELARPINESFDIDQLLIKVIKINQGGVFKSQIVENLKKAQKLK